MTFRIAKFCGAFACALQLLLERSLDNLPLRVPTRKRMSWAFGIKRQASQQDTKSAETSEQALEKLQGFHQLVKVLLLLQQPLLAAREMHVLDAVLSNLQDALERAYQQDTTRHTEDAKKSYRFAINAIYEGLAVQVPSAWLPGTNVNKLRANLNSWLQLAVDRYKHWRCCFLPLMPSGRPTYSSIDVISPANTIRLLLGEYCITVL